MASKKKYSAKDLEGLKVGHDLTEFKEGQEVRAFFHSLVSQSLLRNAYILHLLS